MLHWEHWKNRIDLFKSTRLVWLIGGFLSLLPFIQTLYQLHHIKLPQIHFAHAPPTKSPPAPLSSWHLFGVFNPLSVNGPHTQLPLQLEGTVVDKNNAMKSYALIHYAQQKTKVYRVGQKVAGVTIKSIQYHSILLDHQGVIETLALPVKKLPPQVNQNIPSQTYSHLSDLFH